MSRAADWERVDKRLREAGSLPKAGRTEGKKSSIKAGFFLAERGFTALIRGLTNTIINKNKLIMAKALSKSQIATALAEKSGITKKTATEILEFIAELAYKNAKNTFTLPGLGKLVLVNRKARVGRNPATGETIQIKAKRVVKFRVAKAAKDAILGTK
jgi:DNA-binding protein HU-beta